MSSCCLLLVLGANCADSVVSPVQTRSTCLRPFTLGSHLATRPFLSSTTTLSLSALPNLRIHSSVKCRCVSTRWVC